MDASDRIEPECPACDDSGWIIRRCGGHERVCGRARSHHPHDWADPCPCRPMNRTYQSKVENQKRVA